MTLLRWYRSGKDVEQKLPFLSAYLGHVHVGDTYWYLSAWPELMREAMSRLERRWKVSHENHHLSLAPLLQRFFTQRLMQQRRPVRIQSARRDTFRLLLRFAQQRLHTPPALLTLEAIDAPLIAAFLDHLEKHRGLSVRSRNLRLTAIHSFFGIPRSTAGPCRPDPARAGHSQQALYAASSTFLARPEVEALLDAPDHAPGSVDAITPSSRWQRRRAPSVGDDRIDAQ